MPNDPSEAHATCVDQELDIFQFSAFILPQLVECRSRRQLQRCNELNLQLTCCILRLRPPMAVSIKQVTISSIKSTNSMGVLHEQGSITFLSLTFDFSCQQAEDLVHWQYAATDMRWVTLTKSSFGNTMLESIKFQPTRHHSQCRDAVQPSLSANPSHSDFEDHAGSF